MTEQERQLTGCRNELRMKIDECNELHDELAKRPIKINDVAFNTLNKKGCSQDKVLADAVREGKRFNVKVHYKGESFWVMPIKADEDNGCLGIVNNDVLHSDININDIVGFIACCVSEIDIDLEGWEK